MRTLARLARTVPVVLIGVFFIACSTGTRGGTGSDNIMRSVGSDTFEGWVLQAPIVAIGKAVSVDSARWNSTDGIEWDKSDPETQQANGEALADPYRYQDVTVEIQESIKGEDLAAPGAQVTFTIVDIFAGEGLISSASQGSLFLWVAEPFELVNQDGGRRSILSVFASASYEAADDSQGGLIGVPLFSLFARFFGYSGGHTQLLDRLAKGQPMTAADAFPFDQLVARAKNPTRTRSLQLGYLELQVSHISSPIPQASYVAD